MTDEEELAGHYRKHATTLRAAASFDKDRKTSMALEKIASDYEEMAHSLEAIARTNKGL